MEKVELPLNNNVPPVDDEYQSIVQPACVDAVILALPDPHIVAPDEDDTVGKELIVTKPDGALVIEHPLLVAVQ